MERAKQSPITYLTKYLNTSRYSGDFDLLTRTTARENNNVARPSQFSNTNMFRRAKSSEWDRDVLNNNISELRSVLTTSPDAILGLPANKLSLFVIPSVMSAGLNLKKSIKFV